MNVQTTAVMILSTVVSAASAAAQPVRPAQPMPPAPVIAPMPAIPPMPDLAWLDHEQTGQERQHAEEARERARLATQRDREERLYDQAMRHIYESRWDRAVEQFDAILKQKASHTDAALYWKAYAQDRLGQRAEALTTIAALTRDHKDSRYLQQARALEAEVRRNAGQPVNPQDQADEDLKLMAIVSLQHRAPEEAVPMLEKLLQGTASPKLKERALFVLAQSNSVQARDVLKGIAKGNSTPELQSRAINYLGMHGGADSRAVLAEIYGATTDVDSKKRIIRALAMGGERARVLAAAQSEQNPELRAEAVRMLGVHGGQAELSQLYAKESSPEIRKQIITAMAMGGDASRLTELARTEKDPELRRTAIRSLGMMGGKTTGGTLVEIYNTDRDPAVKRSVIAALGMQDNAEALVAIARKETDASMKKEIVGRLSHMNSKIATDYMLEILGGK
jgi:HEAT repeat protein